MTVGDIEVTALSDGTAALPVDKLLTDTSPAKIQAALSRAYLKAPEANKGLFQGAQASVKSYVTPAS